MTDAFEEMAARSADQADAQLRRVREGLAVLADALRFELDRKPPLAPNERRHTVILLAYCRSLIRLAEG